MSAAQRSKKGCWTCRLRRKKCSEGGFPCRDCEARGVFCHGYGTKPSWKDRGEKEREEALRLQLRTRRRRSQPADAMSSHAYTSSCSSDRTVPERQSSMAAELSMINEPSQDIALEHFEFEYLEPLDLTVATPGCVAERQRSADPTWTAQIDLDQFFDLSIPDMDLTPVSSMTTTFDAPWTSPTNPSENRLELTRHRPRTADPKSPNLLSFPITVAGAQGPQMSEKEIELVMNFLWETYTVQKNSRRPSSTSQSSWLLFLLMNSPTFYFASLSMSAYHLSRSLVGNKEARAVAFQDYRGYRSKALRSFRELSENSTGGIAGETLICGVQVAHLEDLSKNTAACQSYLSSAVQYLVNHEDLFLSNPTPSAKILVSPTSPRFSPPQISPSMPTTPHLTSMQSKALSHFATILLYNDILSSSIRKKPTSAPEIYRKLLSSQSFTLSFQDVVTCESWVLSAIMETNILEIWKRDQQSHSKLSIRELVNRANRIEAILEKDISRISNSLRLNTPPSSADATTSNSSNEYHCASDSQIQTYIFAHAVLIEVHGIVSGPRPNVAEINQTIDRAIAAWEMRPHSMSPKSLAWPYCVSASLASGSQRDFFREIGSPGNLSDTSLANFEELKSVVEECWRESDKRGPNCDTAADWKDIMQRSNLNLPFS